MAATRCTPARPAPLPPHRSHNGRPMEQWTTVKLQHNGRGGLELRGLQVFEAPTEQDALNLLFLGNMHRMTAETLMNRVCAVVQVCCRG